MNHEKYGKKTIYWCVYVLLLLSSIYIKISNILPVKSTTIFLFGLMWIWTGLSLICRINPYYAQKYERRHQFLFAISSVGMGISWNIISLTHLSNQAIPMILISSPFLISDLIIFLRYKK